MQSSAGQPIARHAQAHDTACKASFVRTANQSLHPEPTKLQPGTLVQVKSMMPCRAVPSWRFMLRKRSVTRSLAA